MSPTQFKQARRKLGLTQGQLAAILDTAPQTIRKWEMDETCSTARSVNPVAARVMRWMLDGYRPPEFPNFLKTPPEADMKHPTQALVDSMNEMCRLERSRYHVTLRKMIDAAAKATGNVLFADGGSPGDEMSYRGYYSDLCFKTQQAPKTASEFHAQCNAALASTYVGYKGGDFVMTDNTPLWRASYGCCGEAIVRAVVEDGGDLVLHCISVDD